MISLVPLVIAMFSYFVYLLLDYRDPLVIYVNPFASSMLLGGEAYYGSELLVSYMVSFSSSEIEKSHPIYLISSTLIWSIALTIANMLLIRKLYIVKIEEEKVL
jgi:hypothetical protein